MHEDDQHGGHRACGSADLERRARERSHDKACEDGGDQSRGGGRARGNPERERERKRNRGNGQTCEQVLLKFGERIASELVLVQASETSSWHRLFSENVISQRLTAPPRRPLLQWRDCITRNFATKVFQP